MLIEGESNMRMFHNLQVLHGLALEINSGLKLSSRGSVMKVAKAKCGSSKQTKRGVLIDYVAWMRASFDYEPSGSVLKAMSK